MTEWLWTLATSWALWVAAGVLLVALAVGYFPLIGRVSFLAPYVKAARLVAFLTFGLVCALADRRSADARSEIAQLKRDLSFAELQISNSAATAADKARLADASQLAASLAQTKANTYEQWLATQPLDRCDDLTGDDVDWLRNVQPRRAAAAGSAEKAVGQPLARLRGIGKGLFGSASD